MRIGINTLVAIPSEIGGMQTYLRGLINGLAQVDRDNEYVLFVAPWNCHVFTAPGPNFRQVICPVPLRPLPARVAYEQIVLPLIATQERLDVFHAPANVMPLAMPCPTVVTIHDVLAYRYPESVPVAFRHYWRVMLRLTAARASHVMTDLHASQDDIVRFLGCARDQIQVIYPAPGLFGAGDMASLAQEQHVMDVRKLQPYILWVGKMYRHKNLPALLDGYTDMLRDGTFTHRLVLAGMDGWGATEANLRVRALGIEDHVTFTGRVEDAELAALYRGADIFAFPSLYEGFGLPAVEAMSYGIPVLTSNRGALAEVAGDAAFLVSPEQPSEISRGLSTLLTDSELRVRLSAEGQQRSRTFSWIRAAQQTAALYHQVAHSG